MICVTVFVFGEVNVLTPAYDGDVAGHPKNVATWCCVPPAFII